MMQLLLNFMLLASVLGSVMSVIGASYKIVEIMEHEPDIKTTGGIELEPSCKGEIQIRDVRFAYPTKLDVPILKGVSINIAKNKVVALVG
jgi:ABC-type multidrug transport system fused ATPase/permease subunit